MNLPTYYNDLSNSNSVFNPAFNLRYYAQKFPDKSALIYSSGKDLSGKILYKKKSFYEIDQESDHIAHILQKRGFKPGDKTILMLKAGPELYSLLFGIFKVGVIPVLVDPGMNISQMLQCYKSVNVETFVGSPIAHIVRLLNPSAFSTIKLVVWIVHGKIISKMRYAVKEKTVKSFPIYANQKNDLALINFTSGSTGPAKGAECTCGMAQSRMELIKEHHCITKEDTHLITSPFFGVFGIMMGNTCVLPEMDPINPAKIFSPYIIDAITKFNTTCMFASPALLHTLGNHFRNKKIVLQSLRLVVSGGAPITFKTMKLFRRILQTDAIFESNWGTTEGLPLAAINIDTILNKTQSCVSDAGTCLGKPVDRVEVKVINIDRNPILNLNKDLKINSNEIGELIVRGPNVSLRYYYDETNNKRNKILDEYNNVWHRTGDLGWIDSTGNIWFCGRMSDQIVTDLQLSVLNSVQCEEIINHHPGVYRSALVSAQLKLENVVCIVPVMCVELDKTCLLNKSSNVRKNILELLMKNSLTQSIKHVLFHPAFPVDRRHNAKINRKELGKWASNILYFSSNKKFILNQKFKFSLSMLIPLLGWLFIIYGLIWPVQNHFLSIAWWSAIFLNIIVHGTQLYITVPLGYQVGFPKLKTIFLTFLLGATWWYKL
ncbi:MAG: fatty acid CoA ligase family protein [Pseudomonadota bacterium]